MAVPNQRERVTEYLVTECPRFDVMQGSIGE